jgi:signal peptidase II
LKRIEINKEFLVQFVIAALVLAADQVTKYLVSTRLAIGETWDIAPWVAHVFSITHITNTGVAFGLFQGLGKIFIFTSAIASVAIVLYSRQIPPNQWIMRIALGLALGGSIGNLIDRVRFGGTVTDFIDTNIWPFQNFPVFNIADSCVLIGVCILMGLLVWEEHQERRKQQVAEGG